MELSRPLVEAALKLAVDQEYAAWLNDFGVPEPTLSRWRRSARRLRRLFECALERDEEANRVAR